MDPLQTRYKILAGTNNHEDLLKTMEVLADNVSDVRVKIPGLDPKDDTIAVRAACAAILKNAVDTVRRMRKNNIQRLGSEENSDEPI